MRRFKRNMMNYTCILDTQWNIVFITDRKDHLSANLHVLEA